MKAKHDRLPAKVLVPASKSGLTGDALSLAQSYGIQVLAFETFDENSVEGLFGTAGSLWSKLFTLAASKVVVTVNTGGGEETVLHCWIVFFTPKMILKSARSSIM